MDSNLKDSDKTKVGIYLLRNKDTNEVYVGSGKLNNRLKAHKRELENSSHVNYKLQRSFNKHPNIEFIGSPIDIDGLSIEENRMLALSLEQVFIDKLNGNDLLLNISMKADNPTFGTKLTEERKLEISKSSKRTWETMSEDKINNRNNKISVSQKQRWDNTSKEDRVKHMEAARLVSLNSPITDETRLKLSIAGKGKIISENQKQSISLANKNKPKSLETIERMVATRKLNGSFKANESQKLACSRPVIIDGEKFPSIKAAALVKGISTTTISNRIKDEKFTGWATVSDQVQLSLER